MQALDNLLGDIQYLAEGAPLDNYETLEEPDFYQYQQPNLYYEGGTGRQKRAPLPILSTWLQQRRSASSQVPNPVQPASVHEEAQDPKMADLQKAIRKLQIWETALIRRFGDRFGDSPDNLAMNPLWVQVMKLRSMLKRLKVVAEMQAEAKARGQLDTTRMK